MSHAHPQVRCVQAVAQLDLCSSCTHVLVQHVDAKSDELEQSVLLLADTPAAEYSTSSSTMLDWLF